MPPPKLPPPLPPKVIGPLPGCNSSVRMQVCGLTRRWGSRTAGTRSRWRPGSGSSGTLAVVATASTAA